MTLPIPVLDDRRFDDLVAEARALIPTHAPGWTNHNPSDPGMTLVELFAYLTETLIYRLDRVTPENLCAFLNLLDDRKLRVPVGPGSTRVVVNKRVPATSMVVQPGTERDLADEIRDTVLAMRKVDRAVTARDYEMLAVERAGRDDLLGALARVRCFPRRDLTGKPAQDCPDHVSLVAVPAKGAEARMEQLTAAIAAYLADRRLLGTQVHVVGPSYLEVTVTAFVRPDDSNLRELVRKALLAFLDPLQGGGAAAGWPFGRGIHLSELYALVGRLPQVDSVSITLATTVANRAIVDARHGNRQVGVRLEAHELARVTVDVQAGKTAP